MDRLQKCIRLTNRAQGHAESRRSETGRTTTRVAGYFETQPAEEVCDVATQIED